MSAGEKFLSRWSRLKRESESQKARKTGATENAALSGDAEEGAAGAETRAAPTFDPASLPPIESITADTDISMFLASEVPAELTRAALRRAWVSDPIIRDFIGIAENQWDFTNPKTIPGFGPVQGMSDKLSLIAQTVPTPDRSVDALSAGLSDIDTSVEKTRSVTGSSRCDELGDTAGEKQAVSATCGVGSRTSSAPESGSFETAQNNLLPRRTIPRRRHVRGGALPR